MLPRLFKSGLLALFISISAPVFGQVGINNSSPDASSELDVQSTSKGVLLPRMTTAQMNAITSPATGLALFNSDSSTFYFYSGTEWVKMITSLNQTVSSGSQVSTDNLSAGFLPYWTGSAFDNSSLFYDNGNIGIGITSLSDKLEVDGRISASGLRLTNGSASGYVLKSDASGNASWVSPSQLTGVAGYNSLTAGRITKWEGSTLGDALLYDNGTNVGVGTTDPQMRLDVAGGIRADNIKISSGAGTGLVLVSDANGSATWQTAGAISGAASIDGATTAGVVPRWNGTKLEDGRIFDDGINVGIGTTSPGTRLDVAGRIRGYGLQMTSGAATGYILKSDADGVASWALPSAVEMDPKLASTTTNRVPYWSGSQLVDGLIYDNGNRIGIGTTSPAQILDVSGTTRTTNLQMTSGAASGYVLRSDATGNAAWVAATTLSVTETDPQVSSIQASKVPRWSGTTLSDGTIYDNGTLVGIGTTSPVSTLDVAGVITATGLRLSTDPVAGYVLQSGADGLGSWVAPTSLSITESDPKVGSSNAGYVPRWTGAALADGLIYDNATNVGIGTATPGQKLEVAGKVKATGVQLSTGAANGYVLQSDAGGNGSWVAATTLTVTETDPQVSSTTTGYIPRWTGTTLSDGSIYDNGTRIGINTISVPTESTLVLGLPNGGTTEGGQLQLNGAGSNTTHFIDNFSGSLRFLTGTTSGSAATTAQITSGGLMGVGTTPVSTLDVGGSIGMKVKASQTAGTNNPDATAVIWIYSSGTGTITLPAASTCANRVYTIVNQTGGTRTISSYRDLTATVQTTMATSTTITIVSDGGNWYQFK